ncbi:unnamed protein product [Rhizoctonia solani]|uniref:Allergen protein n=1 Tax=Rhizoctonia solani TaxID=456999 RepID=A0A8H3AP13_9AGAM|nr:unnamed protein product [Rhizoctonia solani]CAE6436700.1 unnamed protein product [Rhizoctonia solani]
MMRLSSALLVLSATLALASPLQPRAAPDNTVLIESATKYCMVMPRKAHTDIGDSETPGGMRVYCSASARTDNSQGLFPDSFWKKVTYKSGTGKKGKKYVQLTGRINKGFSQLNDNDGGGQYDSSGGAGGKGNPQGSVCKGYAHYVQLVEPDVSRACIRCCQDYDDCPLDKDTAGCPSVIPGTY